MAPEVLFGKNHTYSVDFYAMGIMGFEFIFGDRPYEGTTRKALRDEIIKRQARIHSNEIPRGWSREGIDFVNQLMQRKPEKRLGNTNGIQELKEHKWFKNFDWAALENKTYPSPFIPPHTDNYDKEYCEEESEMNLSTNERYAQYLEDKRFAKVFIGYTYINQKDEEEFQKKFEEIQNLQKLHRKELKLKLAPLSMQSLKSEEQLNKKIVFSNPGPKEERKTLVRNSSVHLPNSAGRNPPNILSENLKYNKKNDLNMNAFLKINSGSNSSNNINSPKNKPAAKKITQLKLTASQSMRNLIPDGFLTQKRKFSFEELKAGNNSAPKRESAKKIFLNKPLNVMSNLVSPRFKGGNLPKLSSNSSFVIGHQQPKKNNFRNNQVKRNEIIKVNAPINLNIFHFDMLGSNTTTNLMHSQSTKNFAKRGNNKIFFGNK